MLDGFFDRQHVPQWVREAVAGRPPNPRTTEWFRLVDACYRRADGVVSLLGSTCRVLRQSYPPTPCVEIWHGTATSYTRRLSARLSTIESTQKGPSYNSSAARYPEKLARASSR